MQADKKKLFLRQKRVNIRFYNFVLFTHAKTFHRVFMALIDRDRTHITIELWQQVILHHAVLMFTETHLR